MAGTATIASSTREKLERARAAAGSLAQLSTEQKNSLLLQMADALEACLKSSHGLSREAAREAEMVLKKLQDR